ncbi:MAG: MoaD family protein [Firmicutes bacterium]|nr:MoaD family protein [Bacillota bacterium]
MLVKYFAYIRDYTGGKEIQIEHYNSLRALLNELCKKYGAKFESKVFSGENLSDEIIILINGRNIVHLEGLDTKLQVEDVISIFPVVAGG